MFRLQFRLQLRLHVSIGIVTLNLLIIIEDDYHLKTPPIPGRDLEHELGAPNLCSLQLRVLELDLHV